MVFIVRKDLKMSTGKVGSQCAHAAVKVIQTVHRNINKLREYPHSLTLTANNTKENNSLVHSKIDTHSINELSI